LVRPHVFRAAPRAWRAQWAQFVEEAHERRGSR
jgi:hypothetical protein